MVWLPIDAILTVRLLSSLIVLGSTLVVAALCARSGGGLDGLIVNLPGLAVIWGSAYGLIRLGRWWRGMYPPEHVPRRPVRQASRLLRACSGSRADTGAGGNPAVGRIWLHEGASVDIPALLGYLPYRKGDWTAARGGILGKRRTGARHALPR
jgi:hypothetical protein